VRSNALFAQRFDLARTELVGEPAVVGEQVPSGIGNVGAGSPFAVSETGELVYRSGAVNVYSTQLTWLDRSGKAIATVGQPGDYRSVELSPDGRRVAEHPHENVGGGDTWLLDLTRGTSARFTFGGHTTDAIWSPDGTRLAFGSNRPASGETISDPYAGTFNMYEKRADLTGDATVLLDSTATGHPPTWKQPTSWSPDGRFLVYETYDPKTTWDLWMLPLTGDRKPRPLLRSDFEELEGQISPDGRWLAYTSDESKRWQVNVVPLSGGTGKWQISTDGGRLPRWRGDGKELYFLTDARKLMAVDVRTSGSALEVGIPHPLFDVQIPATFFQPTPIAQTAKTPWPYAVSRDGQRFLVAVDRSQQRAEQPITVVENWTAALKK
jgi:dipeptidyl aminopeptidase/acylaminoacyl peptidase